MSTIRRNAAAPSTAQKKTTLKQTATVAAGVVSTGIKAYGLKQGIKDFKKYGSNAASGFQRTAKRTQNAIPRLAKLDTSGKLSAAKKLYNNKLRGPLNSAIKKYNRVGAPLKSAYDVASLGGKYGDAVSRLKKARATGNAGDKAEARRSVLGAARSTVTAGQSVVQTAQQGRRLRAVARGLKGAASSSATTRARVATRLVSSVTRAASKVMSRTSARLAGKAAVTVGRVAGKVAQRLGARLASKAAARFVPGANVAVAALDVANAVNTFRDPNARIGRRVASLFQAAGSIASATQIPGVMQVGAAVATAAEVAGSVVR